MCCRLFRSIRDAGDVQCLSRERLSFPLNKYHRLHQIYDYFEWIRDYDRKRVSVWKIGRSADGNKIKGIRIRSGGRGKQCIWIDAGIHGREWIATAVALYIAHHLIVDYEKDSRIRLMADSFDWYIFPVINPDGYRYTWTHSRLWKKNRTYTGSRSCGKFHGVDINRNFEIDFGARACSHFRNRSTYPGKYAFSEAESRALRDAIYSMKDKLSAYFSLHGNYQRWTCPYGYTRLKPLDYKDLTAAMEIGAKAMTAKHGKMYTWGTIADYRGAKSGCCVDWVYSKASVKYCFELRLRGSGQYADRFPQNQIVPTAQETWEGIYAVVNYISKVEGL